MLRLRARFGRHSRRPARHNRRRLRSETLEKRLLLVAQGAAFPLNESLDASGLVGDVSAEIRWGDSTTSAATSVVGGNEKGNLNVKFDYSLDTQGFFDPPARRTLLQHAADSIVKRFRDQLNSIVPLSYYDWSVDIPHPTANPSGTDLFAVHKVANPTIAQNTIVIYAGSRNFPNELLRGLGGFGAPILPGTGINLTPEQLAAIGQFRGNAINRGNLGASASVPTDFAPAIGSISFDKFGTDADGGTNWYFGEPAGIQPGQWDFFSFATHELAHAFGFGTAPSWNALVASGSYSGSHANAVFDGSGSVPIPPPACTSQPTQCFPPTHWVDSVFNDHPTLMTGNLSRLQGQSQVFTDLDFAAMQDIGWELVDMQTTIQATHQYTLPGVYTPEVVLRGSDVGQIVYTLDPVTVTPVVQLLTAQFAPSVIREDAGTVDLTVQSSDPDTTSDRDVMISGATAGQLVMPASITIPRGASQRTIQVSLVDDTTAELTKNFSFTFTLANHNSTSADLELLDDEPPAFQNPIDRHDVVGGDGAKASDALRIINELFRRRSQAVGGTIILDPEVEQPNGVFLDVNGDYRLTALDALHVINELPNRAPGGAMLSSQQLIFQSAHDRVFQELADDSEPRLLF